MQAAAKNGTKKLMAAALAAAMAATVAPVAAFSMADTGDGTGVEAAYAATTAQKLAAKADVAASQAPYAAELAKKVADWDGSSKTEVIKSKYVTLYSDGTDEYGGLSADAGKTSSELAKGCAGVTHAGVRWAFEGGKVDESIQGYGGAYLQENTGTLYIDYDGAYDPYNWNDSGFYVITSTNGGAYIDLLASAKKVVIGKHVTKLCEYSMDDVGWQDTAVTFEEPSSLTEVEPYALNQFRAKSITFPSSLKKLPKNAVTGWTARYGDVKFADPSATEVAADAVNTGVWPSKSKKAMGKVRKLTAGKKSLTVSMKRVTGGKAYRVYYRQAGTTKYKSKLVKKLTSKNSTKSTVTCTVKGLKKGKKYQVHYIAYKKTSAKAASAITRTTDKTSPVVR